ncbi:MAG TPA: tetratricopeptide repeat protein [Alphaproteobacteria bacterium]|nr:tetratricopeptide repeat protein [Alphaproteobacteria bacterium]
MRLSGTAIVIVGALASLPRRLAARLVAERGGRLARALSRGSGLMIVGRRSQRPLAEGKITSAIARADLLGVPVIGETGFLNLLGLTDRHPGPPEAAGRFAGRGVSASFARLLALFDVIDPTDELHARQTLKEVRRALAQGMEPMHLLGELLQEPASARTRLPSLTLAPDEAGRLAQRLAGRIVELDGQLRLDLDTPPGKETDALFEAAERAEAAHDWAEAEMLYARCLAREPEDATLQFNLGNVLREQGRLAEAGAAFAKATVLDPEMAEAWFNLACLAEGKEQGAEAARRYRRALAIEPDYADALFNLARLETEHERFADALPLWQRYLKLDPTSRWGEIARKGAALCRQALLGEGAVPTPGSSANDHPRPQAAAIPRRPQPP